MGDPVYRSEQIGIRLVNRGSTYWSRFGRWLKAARGFFIAYVGVYVAIGIVLLGSMGILLWQSPVPDSAEARGWFLGATLFILVPLGFGLVIMAAVGAVKSASHDPAEQLLPRELHLFEDHLMVVPFGGAAFHTPWSAYVLGATATPAGGMQLLLGREPRLEFLVPRGSLSAEQWTLLRRWLVAQDLLNV